MHPQLVLWARSLAIIGIREGYDAAQADGLIFFEAGAAVAVLASVLALHMYVAPYEYRCQNRLEAALSTANLVFVTLLCILNSGTCDGAMGNSLAVVVEVTAMLVLISPALVGLLWLAVSGGRRAVTIARLRELLVVRGGGDDEPNCGLMLVAKRELAVVGQEAADEQERRQRLHDREQFRQRLSQLSAQGESIVGRFAESELRVLAFGQPEF